MRALAVAAIVLGLVACSRKPERVELSPASLRFFGRGQSAAVQAVPWASTGRPMPDQPCRWTSSDERVVVVRARHNEAIVTSSGPGTALVRCTVLGARAEIPVTVRVVRRLAVSPHAVELRVLDVPRPVALKVEAWDDLDTPVAGRAARTRCEDEAVCRGDGRGQLWAVGPGRTRAFVEVEGASAEVAVHAVDARTAAGRPRAVRGNPMEAIEKAVRAREAAERR